MSNILANNINPRSGNKITIGNVNTTVAIAGTATYEDVTSIDSVGIITARSGINVTGGQLNVGSNIKIGNAGVITATSFSGDGSNLTGIAADKIFEGNTEVETVDTGSNGHIKFTTEGTERLRIDSDGRLLIGTTTEGQSSADDLTIANSGDCGITIRSGSSDKGKIFFSDATSGVGEYHGYIQYQHSDGALRFGTNAVEQMRIDNSGRVLIGTTIEGTSSSDNLTVADTGACGITVRSGTSSNGGLLFSDGTSGSSEFRGYMIYEHNTNVLRIGTDATERLRITSGGDVGIGEDSPADRLVVQKTNASGDVGVRIKNDTLTDGDSTNPTTASLYLTTSTGDFNTFYIQARRNDNDTHFGYADPRDANHTPHLVITSGGNVNNLGNVGVQTSYPTSSTLVGAASSLIGLYIGDGHMLFSDNLSRSGGYYIPSGLNALNAGPVTLNSTMTLDGVWVIV